MKAIIIAIEISVFILTLASIPFIKKAAYKKVNNQSHAGLEIKLKRSAWCTFANADLVSIKNPPPSMGSKLGLFKSFRGAMLLLMLITASIVVVTICPFLIYASIAEEVSVFEGILGIIVGFGGCAAMISYVYIVCSLSLRLGLVLLNCMIVKIDTPDVMDRFKRAINHVFGHVPILD